MMTNRRSALHIGWSASCEVSMIVSRRCSRPTIAVEEDAVAVRAAVDQLVVHGLQEVTVVMTVETDDPAHRQLLVLRSGGRAGRAAGDQACHVSRAGPMCPTTVAPMNRPTGIIRLTIQGSVMTSNMITPTCRINGHPVPTRYGAQDLTVWAGPNHPRSEAQWMRTPWTGCDRCRRRARPGRRGLLCRATASVRAGNIGLVKQSRPG